MKNMISKFSTILIYCLIIASCNTSERNKNNVLVSDINKFEELIVSSAELDDYYNTTSINKNSKFKELEISKSGNYYYLFAQDQESLKQYAFTLEISGNKIFLNKNNEVHSCEAKKNVECNFIKNNDGKIVGCDNCNHTISISD